jgi:hypothetical protein
MDQFDCYCFLCSGPLWTVETLVGSHSPPALRRRRRSVERRRLARTSAGRHPTPSRADSPESPRREDEGHVPVLSLRLERCRYDPKLVYPRNTRWLQNVVVLGRREDASGVPRFVSTVLLCPPTHKPPHSVSVPSRVHPTSKNLQPLTYYLTEHSCIALRHMAAV